MNFKKEPSLAEFAKIFDSYIKDIMNVNDPDEFIYSHKIKGSISVYTDDAYDDTMYEIVGLDLDYLGGCGCTSGITIRVKKIED